MSEFELAEELVLTGNAGKAEMLADAGLNWVSAASASMNELSSTAVSLKNAFELVKVVHGAAAPSHATSCLLRSPRVATKVFRLTNTSLSPSIADTSELGPLVDAVIAANPSQAEAYRGGKEGLLGFFVGQVMKETGGKANPKVVNDLLREKLRA